MRRFTLLFIVGVVATAVLALFTLFTPTAQADEVGGIIDTDTTWTLAGSPYIITDTVIIQPGVTLTVEAGVEVQAQPGTAVQVNGNLLALGTAAQPITFTSTAETGPGDWYGIIFDGWQSPASAHLNNVLIQYSDFGIYLMGSTAIVENTIVLKIIKS